jgi:hypothetical protein
MWHVGVPQVCSDPVEPLSDVGGVHRASRDIDAPAGVTFSRQISAHSVEPTIASRSRNLLSHDDRGPTGGDEAMEVGPQVPWIVYTGPLARDAEGLAGAWASPDWPVVWPPGEAECEAPATNACEEVALGKPGQVRRSKINNWRGADFAIWDKTFLNQIAQPLRGIGLNFVVEGSHQDTSGGSGRGIQASIQFFSMCGGAAASPI